MRRICYMLGLVLSTACLGQSKLPTSADHVFVPHVAVKNPQPVSFFSMLVGLQQSDNVSLFNTELPTLGPVNLTGEVLFADIGIKASIRLKDWISYRLNYNASVRVGTDVSSLLIQGINSVTTYESLWQIRFLHTPRFTAAGTFGFNRIDADLIDVAGYIGDLLEGAPDPSVERKIRSLTGELGIVGSYAVNSVIGVLFESDVEIGDHVGSDNARIFWSAAGSVDFNFNERYDIPVGAVLSLVSTTLPEFVVPERRQATALSLKLAYTGSDVYNIGLTISESRFPLEKVDERTSFSGFQLNGRFFF